MTAQELARVVRDMRAAQGRYFRYRRPDDLERSKALEKQVDRAVEQILNPQMGLFDDNDSARST